MKKLISFVLALMFVCVSFAACGKNGQNQEKTNTETSPELATEVEKVREYVREEMGAEIELQGNSVVYVFTVDKSEEECEIAANAVEDTVLSALEEARKDLPMIESFVYEYRDADGNKIYEQEYKPIV